MKLNPRVFKAAAKKCENSQFACVAIIAVTGTNSNYRGQLFELTEYYQDLFDPRIENYGAWFGERTDENQLARELSLLFTAEVLRDEQRRGK